ncbi:hypothetical protein CCACVL1_02750 [Corchorus capsularis]|uniref:Uncharacterized protein n=1 Tax=Corchorus capsularis TaxID=210143 RepID=A0A1R3K6A8_COCAP|nr:hypothetical protein CCACVL1_02750 [Corchorus capsularis]
MAAVVPRFRYSIKEYIIYATFSIGQSSG